MQCTYFECMSDYILILLAWLRISFCNEGRIAFIFCMTCVRGKRTAWRITMYSCCDSQPASIAGHQSLCQCTRLKPWSHWSWISFGWQSQHIAPLPLHLYSPLQQVKQSVLPWSTGQNLCPWGTRTHDLQICRPALYSHWAIQTRHL